MIKSKPMRSMLHQHNQQKDSSAISSASSIPKTLAEHHRTAASNQFQYNSHLKRHSLQRLLIEKDGTSSITKFMNQAEMQRLLDYEVAGAYDPLKDSSNMMAERDVVDYESTTTNPTKPGSNRFLPTVDSIYSMQTNPKNSPSLQPRVNAVSV